MKSLEYKCRDYDNAEEDIMLLFESEITAEKLKRRFAIITHSRECKKCQDKTNEVMEAIALCRALFVID